MLHHILGPVINTFTVTLGPINTCVATLGPTTTFQIVICLLSYWVLSICFLTVYHTGSYKYNYYLLGPTNTITVSLDPTLTVILGPIFDTFTTTLGPVTTYWI